MAFCRLLFPLAILSVVSASTVPVFLWGNIAKSPLVSNPLSTITAKGFSEILKKEIIEDPYVVVFVEETLSVEDFARKNYNGESSFPFLHDSLDDALYLPSVAGAFEVLKKITEGAVHAKLTQNGLSEAIENKNNKYTVITLDDAKPEESRYDLLRRHNDFMQTQISLLENKGDVVAVYTARNPSWTIPTTHSRARRQANETQPDQPTSIGPDFSQDGILLYTTSITIAHSNTTDSFSDYAGGSSQYNTSTNTLNTTLNFAQGSVTLNFYKKAGYWFFDTVHLVQPSVDEVLVGSEEVYALEDFAYRCKQSVSFKSVNETLPYVLTLNDIKVQPFFAPTNDSTKFGDSFNCVGFFSAPIWSGLFVVFILLGITFYGIMFMMDIKTMDRFDDPKGKTITINASE